VNTRKKKLLRDQNTKVPEAGKKEGGRFGISGLVEKALSKNANRVSGNGRRSRFTRQSWGGATGEGKGEGGHVFTG